MKLQYLGTAAAEGWPALFCRCPACTAAMHSGGRDLRTRSQALIDDRLLIDFCPDTLAHVQQLGLPLPEIRHCLITHTHDDHFSLADIRLRGSWFAADTGSEPLTLYGNGTMVSRMEEQRTGPRGEIWTEGLAWRQVYPYMPFGADGYRVTPVAARHGSQEQCLNYIIERDGQSIFYGHDTGLPGEDAWAELVRHRFTLVSLDCTKLVGRVGGTHMNIDYCAQVRERMLREGCADGCTRFVLNHFTHFGGVGEDGRVWLHRDLEELVKPLGFMVAYDGMTVTL